MKSKAPKAVEDIYQKVTQTEHILKRPETYVGSIERQPSLMWIKPEASERFEQKTIEYVPGLYKIFDEIIVNAADNFQRDPSTSMIKVWIDRAKNEIRVYNNGEGIPVQVHAQHRVYVPELIFGHLLSGSNFDDNEKKVTGGRNGFGAKLANIFSTRFSLETADGRSKKCFRMTWTNNMANKTEPEIFEWKKESYTQVTFTPDLPKFGLREIDKDIYALFCKRVYDLAGVISEKVKVFLNDTHIAIRGFERYVDLYFPAPKPEAEEVQRAHFKQDRWEVVLAINDDQFQQVSFVNSICTSHGGSHVNAVMDQVVETITEEIKKKNKKSTVKPAQIKNNFWIFLNCLIENPAFESQTKETLSTRSANFGSKCQLDDKFFKKLMKFGIIEQILMQAELRDNARMKKVLQGKKRSKLTGIAKLEDANMAGTKDSEKCLLILTEGDSAKSLAMAGMEVVGRDYFGVFPLRGKLLNVREAPKTQITQNEEIQHLIEILGLQVGKTYEDLKSLRYGGIMIMTDQDVDGSHIKGLIINFVAHFWPSLIKHNGFMKEFITPILKVSKGSTTHSFYTINDYKRWAETLDIAKWKTKYYKGLGTSTDKEAKEYFSEIGKHRLEFVYEGVEDEEKIDLLFNKKKADMRKEWLTTYSEGNVLDHNIKRIRYRDFIDKELIHFSVYDCMRSIPNLVDGFKPGQRKIMFGCFKRNLVGEIKVAQLSGYIAEHSAYHHGEVSLQSTIVNLAQNYVGSNNINLLEPIGQFGTRALGGKDAASARYIYTQLSKITRFIFHKSDDEVLTYLNDDGQFVEPNYFVPIIPMVLVNGAEGIGTGWATNIPCFSPYDLVANLLRRLGGEPFLPMPAFFKGFTGEVIRSDKNYLIKGAFRARPAENILDITELPVGKWTRAYKTFLEGLMADNPIVEDFREYHTTKCVHFEVQLKEGVLQRLMEKNEVEKTFKLTTTMSGGNFVLFDRNGVIRRFQDEVDILEEFFEVRIAYYTKRKEFLISNYLRDIAILENKERFIVCVIEDEIKLRNVRKKEVVRQLIAKKFRMMRDMPRIRSFLEENKILQATAAAARDAETGANETENTFPSDDETETKVKEFNYLLNMPIWSLSFEQVEKLKKEVREKRDELERLHNYTEAQMWRDDLLAFRKRLEELEQAELVAQREEDDKLRGMGKGKYKKKSLKAPKRREKLAAEAIANMDTMNSESMGVIREEKQPKTILVPKLKKTLGGRNRDKSKDQSFVGEEKPALAEPGALLEELKAKDYSKLTLRERLQLKSLTGSGAKNGEVGREEQLVKNGGTIIEEKGSRARMKALYDPAEDEN